LATDSFSKGLVIHLINMIAGEQTITNYLN